MTRAITPLNRDEAVQPMRERNFSRVVKGAQSIGKPVDDLSNRQRRLLAAVTDLPELFETNRPDRTDGDILSRDLTALRRRLDWLVRLEDDHGPDQRGCHENRAERNALVRVLRAQAEQIGEAVAQESPKAGRKYSPAYIARMLEQIEECILGRWTVTKPNLPGLLFHEKHTNDAEPIEVPMAVWFGVRGRSGD